jgi:8-amino-3,8-dideoxy-alpha-D-manno-octulosonate transaminase
MPGFELFGEEERKAVNDLFDANNGILFAHGFDKLRKGIYKVREFEKAVASRLEVKYAQAVSSGTTALLCAMKAMGVGPGDEVITQSFTFVATVEAILAAGAKPVIVNINESLNIDPHELSGRLTSRTKLIVPVHMAGVSAEMDEISQIALDHNLMILEDCAQSLGGTYKGKYLGTIGDAGILSLDFGKTITCGEGGMILTNDDARFFEARCYHDHGHEYNQDFPRGLDTRHAPGLNLRMTELQAAIGLAQLNKLDTILERQRNNKARLKEGLKDLPLRFRMLPDQSGDIGDTCFFFVEAKEKAEEIVRTLGAKGLGTKNVPDAINWHFAGTWDHMLGQFYKRSLMEEFQPSLRILERTVALPIWVLTEDLWIDRYIDAIHSCF